MGETPVPTGVFYTDPALDAEDDGEKEMIRKQYSVHDGAYLTCSALVVLQFRSIHQLI